MTTKDLISKKPDLIKAFLTAEIKGWKDSLADPTLGAGLAANKYGKGLGLTAKEQTLESTSQNLLINTPDTKTNGIFTITPDLIAANIKTLKFAGYTVTAEQLFDMSIIEEVYKENPSLI
jgi:ABC-type nitrate/sulfonate/bicarbonate transport system substrate-binding protein